MTLFEAVYEQAMQVIPTYTIGSSSVDELDCTLQDLTKVLWLLKDKLNATQARMKQQANKHQSKWEFEVGDWVNLIIKFLSMSILPRSFHLDSMDLIRCWNISIMLPIL
jgi:hypothetical protein